MICAEDDPIAEGEFRATSLPKKIETVNVIRPDLVLLDQNISTIPGDADLAVVMNITVAHPAAASDADPCPTIQAHFGFLDAPATTFARLDCAPLYIVCLVRTRLSNDP